MARVRHFPGFTILAAVASSVVLGGGAPTARAADPGLVPVKRDAPAAFGSFRESVGQPNAAARLRAAFGAPTRVISDQQYSCKLTWDALGVTAFLTTYGLTPKSACTDGYFVGARLLGTRWHTPQGVRVGSSATFARRHGVCGPGKLRCLSAIPRGGVMLSVHTSDCAGGIVGTVVAGIARGRVVSLWVHSRGCE